VLYYLVSILSQLPFYSSFFFFFSCSGPHRALHSFPTRRSSDLAWVFSTLLVSEVRKGSVLLVSVTVPLVASFVMVAWDFCLDPRSEEHTSELQSRRDLVCRLLLEKKKKKNTTSYVTTATTPSVP